MTGTTADPMERLAAAVEAAIEDMLSVRKHPENKHNGKATELREAFAAVNKRTAKLGRTYVRPEFDLEPDTRDHTVRQPIFQVDMRAT